MNALSLVIVVPDKAISGDAIVLTNALSIAKDFDVEVCKHAILFVFAPEAAGRVSGARWNFDSEADRDDTLIQLLQSQNALRIGTQYHKPY